MKIFITGCTSPQASKNNNENFPSFAGILYKALVESGNEVVWGNPSISMDKEYLSQFDSVFVGLASPLGLTSHRLYGALSVVNETIEIGNLSLFIDSPEPHKVWNGIRGVYKQPMSLVKDFYSKRQEFDLALEKQNFEKIYSAISHLYTGIWPKTIVPGYPWTSPESVVRHIPNLDSHNVSILCPDSALLNPKQLPNKSDRQKYWCIDDVNTEWSKKIEKNVTYPIYQYRQGRSDKIIDVLTKLESSIGLLVSTYKNNDSWWSPGLAIGLSSQTPIVTDWRLSQFLGEEWTKLPSQVEDMSVVERNLLAIKQKESYLKAIPSWNSFQERVSSLVSYGAYSVK